MPEIEEELAEHEFPVVSGVLTSPTGGNAARPLFSAYPPAFVGKALLEQLYVRPEIKCKSGKMQAKEMQAGCQMRLGQARAATDGGGAGCVSPPRIRGMPKKCDPIFPRPNDIPCFRKI